MANPNATPTYSVRVKNVPMQYILEERGGFELDRSVLVHGLLRLAGCYEPSMFAIKANSRGPEFFIGFTALAVAQQFQRFYEQHFTAWIAADGSVSIADNTNIPQLMALACQASLVTNPTQGRKSQLKEGCISVEFTNHHHPASHQQRIAIASCQQKPFAFPRPHHLEGPNPDSYAPQPMLQHCAASSLVGF